MRLFNNLIANVREKKQEKIGLLFLPDNKLTSSKCSLVVAAAQLKLKEAIVDNEVEPGDRVLSYQYDYGFVVKVPVEIELKLEDNKTVISERLPEKVIYNKEKNTISLKKGAELQLVDRDVLWCKLEDGQIVDDQNM